MTTATTAATTLKIHGIPFKNGAVERHPATGGYAIEFDELLDYMATTEIEKLERLCRGRLAKRSDRAAQ